MVFPTLLGQGSGRGELRPRGGEREESPVEAGAVLAHQSEVLVLTADLLAGLVGVALG